MSDELPDGWAISDVMGIGAGREQVVLTGPFGSKLKTSDFQASGVPVLTIGCLTDGGLELQKANYIAPDVAESLGRYQLREGDLLFSRMASVGRSCIVPAEHAGSIFNYHLMRLRLSNEAYDSKLFVNYVHGAEPVDAYLREVNHGATRDGINTSQLLAMPVLVPPRQEQRRIVDKIDALHARSAAARAALQAIPSLLDRFRQSVLAAAFRGDLTRDWRAEHPDVEPASVLLERIRAERRRRWIADYAEKARARAEKRAAKKSQPWTAEDDAKALETGRKKGAAKYSPPEPVDASGLPTLPNGWCWARWSEVGLSQNGRAFPSKHYRDDGIRLLRPGNLHASGEVRWTASNTRHMPVDWARRYPNFLVGPKELVINLTAQSLKDEFLGRVCLTGPGEECLLNQRIARLTPVNLSSRFCLWLLKSPVFRRYVGAGLNSGSLIQHMFTSQIDEFTFPLPPLAEHRSIVQSVEQLMDGRVALDQCLVHLSGHATRIDQSILAKAFRGELVPQDPNDEPASALLERIRAEREAAAPKKKRRGRKPRKPKAAPTPTTDPQADLPGLATDG